MDTTPDRPEHPEPVLTNPPDPGGEWDQRIADLATGDPADAPEVAEQIASELSNELDETGGAPAPQQLDIPMEGPGR